MLFALIVIVDQLVGGKERCPTPLVPPCRHCLEPLCASSHCLPSHRAVILQLPPRACSIPNPSTPSLSASPCHWLRPHAPNTSLVFSDCCSQNSAGWRGWKEDKHQSSTSRQTQQSTHNKYIRPQMQIHQKSFLPQGSEQSRLRQESNMMRWVQSQGPPQLLWPLGFVQALEDCLAVTTVWLHWYLLTSSIVKQEGSWAWRFQLALRYLIWYQDWQLCLCDFWGTIWVAAHSFSVNLCSFVTGCLSC